MTASQLQKRCRSDIEQIAIAHRSRRHDEMKSDASTNQLKYHSSFYLSIKDTRTSRMDDEYYSLESILADNHVCLLKSKSMRIATDEQKLSCTFTLDVPGLGYLEGGTEADVRLSHFSSPAA